MPEFKLKELVNFFPRSFAATAKRFSKVVKKKKKKTVEKCLFPFKNFWLL